MLNLFQHDITDEEILNQVQDDKKRIYQKYKKGFGILEVLVSSVIIITILSLLVFIGRSALANSLYAQQKAQVIYLAQEGIEQVRQIRDTNWIDGDNTTQFDSVVWNSAKNDLQQLVDGEYVFYYNSTLKRYGLTANASGESISIDGQAYTRKIILSSISSSSTILPGSGVNNINKSDQSFKATIRVTWDINGQAKNIEASEILTNWRPNY